MNRLYTQHYKALFTLGIPIIIGQIGIIILGFADTLMIGHYGTNELAAASFVNNMFTLAIIFATGFSYGLTPVVGSLFGRGESRMVGRVLKNSLFANTLLAVLLTAIMVVLYANLHRLGQPEELLPLMRPYFIVLLISLLFVLLFSGFKQFADGITDTRISMWILLGGNLLNIIGNYILIYGKCGLPEMGLLGAGVSTLASRILMVVAFALFFFCSKRYRVYKEGFLQGMINRADFLHLNRLGWPVAMQMGMETASFSLSTVMVGWIGTTALAAHQIMLTVSQVCFMIYYGMGAAVAVRISNFHGQGNLPAVRRVAQSGFHLILLLAVCTSLPIFLLRHDIGYWFVDDAAVSLMVMQLVIPVMIYQFGDGLQCNYANALRGISDVKPVMYIAFVAYLLVSLPAGYLFGFVMGWGIVGVWMAFPFGLTTAGALYYWRFRTQTVQKHSETL
ncbi:MAG: MATE family efflux transporter [Bacteroidales bacterium]|nr:MATE family efflux transporter [Bacteroidales bacterium]